MIIKYRKSVHIKRVHIIKPGAFIGETPVYLIRSRGQWKVYNRSEPLSCGQLEVNKLTLSSAAVLEILAAAEEEPGAIEIAKQALTMGGYL